MNSTVLVTGGSGGIGGALCARLAEAGVRPVVGYCAKSDLAEQIALDTGGIPLKIDFDDAGCIDRAAATLAGYGGLEAVVLAASPPPTLGPFGKITPEEARYQWMVNVAGPQRLLQSVIRSNFQKQKKGAVIGILTAAMASGNTPAFRGMGAYVIAKYGQAGLLDVLAAEYPWLRVRSIRPGYTDTDMLKVFDERFLENYEKANKILSPDEVAQDIMQALNS